MKTDDLIKKAVFALVEREELFTSLDISQSIKKGGSFVRNASCRDWMHANFLEYVNESASGNIFADPNIPAKFSQYILESIKVRGGSAYATLYRPKHKDSKEYSMCDQVPLTYAEVEKIKELRETYGSTKSTNGIPTSVTLAKKRQIPDITDILDGDTDIVSRSISSDERIKIPGAITKKLGWSAGALIDGDKAKLIKTDKPIPAGLKINKDLRISIPRDIVAIPNPVKVRCDGYIITFEKA